eukprot:3612611-Rhodomonas_salina.1
MAGAMTFSTEIIAVCYAKSVYVLCNVRRAKRSLALAMRRPVPVTSLMMLFPMRVLWDVRCDGSCKGGDGWRGGGRGGGGGAEEEKAMAETGGSLLQCKFKVRRVTVKETDPAAETEGGSEMDSETETETETETDNES